MTTEVIAIVALSLGFAACLSASAIIIYIIRWKTAFVIDNGESRFQLIPDDVVNRTNTELKKQRKSAKKNETFQKELAEKSLSHHESIAQAVIASSEGLRVDQRKAFDAHQATLVALRALQEETKILRSEIQNQAKELERHRQGYDIDILSVSLIPVARMHRMIRNDLLLEDLPKEARAVLEVLEDEHLGILETKGVKMVDPIVGTQYKDQKNVRHPPEAYPTTDESAWGNIKLVRSSAYEMETTVRNVVLLEAEVVVYCSPPTESAVTEIIGGNGEEKANG